MYSYLPLPSKHDCVACSVMTTSPLRCVPPSPRVEKSCCGLAQRRCGPSNPDRRVTSNAGYLQLVGKSRRRYSHPSGTLPVTMFPQRLRSVVEYIIKSLKAKRSPSLQRISPSHRLSTLHATSKQLLAEPRNSSRMALVSGTTICYSK